MQFKYSSYQNCFQTKTFLPSHSHKGRLCVEGKMRQHPGPLCWPLVAPGLVSPPAGHSDKQGEEQSGSLHQCGQDGCSFLRRVELSPRLPVNRQHSVTPCNDMLTVHIISFLLCKFQSSGGFTHKHVLTHYFSSYKHSSNSMY